MAGPLGVLPGMTFDPERNRYFPTPKEPPPDQSTTASGSGSRSKKVGPGGIVETWSNGDCVKKRSREGLPEEGGAGTPGRRLRRGRMGLPRRIEMDEGSVLTRLQLDSEHQLCACEDEKVTFYQSFGSDSYLATTDHGKLAMYGHGKSTSFMICPQALAGMHYDLARMTRMTISAGPDPHIHLYRRDPAILEQFFMTNVPLKNCGDDFFCIESFDDRCTIGGYKRLTTITITPSSSHIIFTPRKLPSDPLAIHHHTRDLIYVGQRSGVVTLDDLRTKSGAGKGGGGMNVVGRTVGGKAVVGVRRVGDEGVGWGLVVSGLGDEMLLYDTRYSDEPLLRYAGHVNNYQTEVSLALSPSSSHLIASGSDNRLRGWSTSTGQPLLVPGAQETLEGDEQRQDLEENPFTRQYNGRIRKVVVREDLGLDVVVKGGLLRFGK